MYLRYEKGEKFTKGINPDEDISDNLDAFEDAGYIIEPDELIVDIDNLSKDAIRAMIEMFDIHTQIEWTDRGAHLYFKKPHGFRKRESNTPLGIHVEYFYKRFNENYTTICAKRDGVARKVENYGSREELPEILKTGKYENLTGLQEGEERNNMLYKHKKRIRKMDGWFKILDFINEHVFAEPLDKKEFSQLTRDEGVQCEIDEEYEMADYIMREMSAVSYNHRLYMKDYDGNYTCNDDLINRIVYQYCPGKKSRFVEEVVKQMVMRAPLVPNNTEFKVKFENGYLYKGHFYECNYDGFTPYVLNVEYDKDAEPVAIVDKYLDQLSDNNPEYRDRLIEIISHCFVVNKEFKRMLSKFHVIRGSGGNGKGTFLQVIKAILGSENCSALSIKQMGDERYFFNMVGKLANLGDDIHNAPINDDQMKIIKNITTCDPVEIRKMRENSTTEEMVITLIFTSNHILKTFEKSEAYKRRVDWLPIFTKPEKKDPLFITKLTTPEAVRYWIRLAVEGYYRLYENKGFTECAVVHEFNSQYHEENDNTTTFVESLEREQIIGKRPPEIYSIYEQWCIDNGDDPLSKKTLKESIQKTYGLIVKNIRDKTTKRVIKAYTVPKSARELKMLL